MLELTSQAGEREATLTATVEPIEPGATLDSVVDRALSRQTRLPGAMRLIDRRPERIGDLQAVQTVGCRETGERLVTVDEWRALAGERLVTVSGVCASPVYDHHADEFAATARSIRVEGERRLPRAHPRFHPGSGLLVVSDAGFDALCAVARDGADRGAPAPEVEKLTASGVLVKGHPHPILEDALRPVLAAAMELAILRGPDRARGWVSGAGVCLLLPAGDDLRRVAVAPAARLPALLADLVRLAPRATPRRRGSVKLAPKQLALLLAEQHGSPAAASNSAGVPSEARRAVAGLRDHWRLETRRPGAATEMVEVIDAGRGLWFVIPIGEAVELRPTGPVEVWRHLNRLISVEDGDPGGA